MKNTNTADVKKRKWFYFFLILYIALLGVDLVMTYIGTPDLAHEANPLVMILNFGWTGLLITLSISTFIFILLLYLVFLRFKRRVIPCEGYKNYMSVLFFNRPDKYVLSICGTPSNKVYWHYFIIYNAFYITVSFYLYRVLCIVDWIGDLTGRYATYFVYNHIQRIYFGTFSQRLVVIGIGGLVWITGAIIWYYREYKINKKALTKIYECDSNSNLRRS